ncbi:hypothetical protein [Listeria booriae]|uniref:Uncharacterized protein n=1 Tax=Listeria booriae TaxID=1552123 RepID=A0A7X1BUZ9_9LIST|nr:hypothetical protein [Listeria booriae]MBC1227702.1 hypothetical protein [Listeria booriae]MBC1285758.1 hypothetical protein [Listeria booriae]MBC1308512.1 hypothetical protein [Listeria booriae]MBC1332662.1 hypothetical protein [Listeria booriae]MBC1919185.1 hypothetical protein [Listeria booriae]
MLTFQENFMLLLIYLLIFYLMWRDYKKRIHLFSSILITGNFVFAVWKALDYGRLLDEKILIKNQVAISVITWGNLILASLLLLYAVYIAIKKEFK